jgi:hypothetical protein
MDKANRIENLIGKIEYIDWILTPRGLCMHLNTTIGG